MNENRIDVVANALAKAWREGGAVSPLAEELWPADLAEGYQTQDALDERLDFELVGWKIGMTNQAAMKERGFDHPVQLGRVYREIMLRRPEFGFLIGIEQKQEARGCLLYTSDAADE